MGTGASTLCAHVEVKNQHRKKSQDLGGTKSTKEDEHVLGIRKTNSEGDLENFTKEYAQNGVDLYIQQEIRTPNASTLPVVKQDNMEEFKECYDTNQHAYDHTIHPVGDLAVSQCSNPDDEIDGDFSISSTIIREIRKSMNPMEIDKLSSQQDEVSLRMYPIVSHDDEQSLSVDAKPKVDDLKVNASLNGCLSSINLSPPVTMSSVETAPITIAFVLEDPAEKKNGAVMTDLYPLPQDVKTISCTSTTQAPVDRLASSESSLDTAVQCSSADDDQRDSTILPMCPEDFASHSGKPNSKLRRTVKVPEVSEPVASVHQALEVRLPLQSYESSTECKDPDSKQYTLTTGAISSLQNRNSDFKSTNPLLVDCSISHYSCTADANTVTVSEKIDAETSMYVCLEGSETVSQKIIPEIADISNTLSTNLNELPLIKAPKNKSTNESKTNRTNKRLSNMGNVWKLSKCFTLPTLKYGDITHPLESNITTCPYSTTIDSLKSTIPSQNSERTVEKSETTESNLLERRTNSQPPLQVERTSSYIDFTNESSTTNRFCDDADNTSVSKYSVTCVQTETTVLVDDENCRIDGPYSVDVTREALIRTPSLEDAYLRRFSSISSKAMTVGDNSCTAQMLNSVRNILPPAMVQTTTEGSRKTGQVYKEKIKKKIVPEEQNKVSVQLAPDINSPAQIERNLEQASRPSSGLAYHPAVLTKVYNIRSVADFSEQQQQLDQKSLELTDFLQVLQSADDFDILPNESSCTEVPDLKVSTNEMPEDIIKDDSESETMACHDNVEPAFENFNKTHYYMNANNITTSSKTENM